MHAITPQGLSQFAPQGPIPDEKRASTLFALLALTGRAAHRLDSGGYLVTGVNCSHHCLDLEALEGFARQVGALG